MAPAFHAKLSDDGLRGVGQQQRHALALLDPLGDQRRTKGIAQSLQLGVRHACALENQGRVVGPLAHGVAHHIQHCDFGVWL